jgi:hypothetical protein
VGAALVTDRFTALSLSLTGGLVRCLLEQAAVHEVEVVLGIVQREVQVHQGSKFRFKDFLLWDRPLLVRELQSGFEPSVERWVGQRKREVVGGGSPIPFKRLVEFSGQEEADCHGEAPIGFGDKTLGEGEGKGGL